MKRTYYCSDQLLNNNKEEFGKCSKEPRMGMTAVNGPVVKQRRAVPPGYLHDLLHTRHLMKSVGLQIPPPAGQQRKTGPLVAVTNGRLQAPIPRKSHQHQPSGLRHSLKSLFEQRTKYLEKRRRKDRHGTSYQQHPGRPVGLLSMPEEVLLKIMCYLRHDEVAPMFTVCKQLHQTLKNAVQFHFNYVTPSRGTAEGQSQTPQQNNIILKKRPEKRKAVTALADVMAHLRRGHSRSSSYIVPQGPTACPQGFQHLQGLASGPRVLSFTPAGTPLGDEAPTTSSQPSPVGQLRL